MQNFNDGQEIIHEDLNKVSTRLEKFMLDKVLYELIGRTNEGFFQDSMKVTRVSNNELSVKAGMGFQYLVDDIFLPNMKPMFLSANLSVIVPTANPTNDRIDILVIKAELVNGSSESRKYKDAFTNDITNQSTVVTKEWVGTVQIVSGVADPAPVAPAIPAGYVKISEVLVEAANGVTSEVNLTDFRVLLPLAGTVGITGVIEYDAVIGDTNDLGVSHETLKAALDDPAILSGAKILVTRNESIGTTPEVTKDNLEIVFKPNVTFTKGGAVKGLIINADGVTLSGARFTEFSTVSDTAIEITGTKKFNVIEKCRFLNCDSQITGLVGKNISTNNIEE